MKPWIFAIVAVAAFAVVFHSPEHKAEGGAVVSSVTGKVDPVLHQGLSEGTHQELEQRSKQAADFVRQTGEDFGVDLTFETDK